METCEKDAASLVHLALGEDFVGLLMELPDEFYRLPIEAKQATWARILAAINLGVNDIDQLALSYCQDSTIIEAES